MFLLPKMPAVCGSLRTALGNMVLEIHSGVNAEVADDWKRMFDSLIEGNEDYLRSPNEPRITTPVRIQTSTAEM